MPGCATDPDRTGVIALCPCAAQNGLEASAYLAALPLASPGASYSCPFAGSNYDTYALTWYRAGLPVEVAGADDTGCAMWRDDGVLLRLPVNADAFYADINAAAGSGG